MSGQIKHFYEFGRFRLAPEERLLLHDGTPVAIAPKAFEMLVVLVSHDNHLLTKGELLKSVGTDTIVEANNLDKNISSLRKILSGAGAGGDSERVGGGGSGSWRGPPWRHRPAVER